MELYGHGVENAKKLVVNPASQSEVVYEPLQVIMPPERKILIKMEMAILM